MKRKKSSDQIENDVHGLHISVSKAFLKRLKLLAIEEESTMGELVMEIMEPVLARRLSSALGLGEDGEGADRDEAGDMLRRLSVRVKESVYERIRLNSVLERVSPGDFVARAVQAYPSRRRVEADRSLPAPPAGPGSAPPAPPARPKKGGKP